MKLLLKPSVWDKAVKITSMFEGWLSGNFDGQYLSYGFLQWNLGQGTLQPLLKRLFNEFPQVAAKLLPGGGTELKTVLTSGTEKAWALSIQKNNRIMDPWLTGLRNLYATPEWQRIMNDASVRYKDIAISMCQKFNIYTDRAFCLFFDIAVQLGSLKSPPAIITLANIAEAAALQANPKWQGDVRARKMAIVNGKDMGRGWDRSIAFTDDQAFDITLIVNGKPLQVDDPPVIINGHTFVPVAVIAQALGKSVSWDGSTRTVTIK